jgi:hypothetical protein
MDPRKTLETQTKLLPLNVATMFDFLAFSHGIPNPARDVTRRKICAEYVRLQRIIEYVGSTLGYTGYTVLEADPEFTIGNPTNMSAGKIDDDRAIFNYGVGGPSYFTDRELMGIVAHEFSHIMNNDHPHPKNPSKERENEMAADRFAAEHGFADGLYAANEKNAQLNRAFQVKENVANAERTHPTYEARQRMLKSYMRKEAA